EQHSFNGTWMRPLPPDGRTILRSDGGVRLFDLETGKDLRLVVDAPATQYPLAFSPDGQRFVGRTSPANTINVWDVSTGRPVTSLPPPPAGPDLYGYPVLARGGRVLAQVGTGRLRVFEVASGRERLVLPLQGANHCAAFTPDGRGLVVGFISGEVVGIDLDAGKEFVRRKAHRG